MRAKVRGGGCNSWAAVVAAMAGTGCIDSGGDRRGSTTAVGGAREMVAAGAVVAAVDMTVSGIAIRVP
jgi:hypothetical protein